MLRAVASDNPEDGLASHTATETPAFSYLWASKKQIDQSTSQEALLSFASMLN